MRLYILSLLAFGVFFREGRAQEKCALVVQGRVVNEQSQPLPGATIVVAGNSSGAASDDRGHYEISNLCPGTVSLTVQFLGYATQHTKVRIKADTEINFQLTPVDSLLNEIVVHDQADQITRTTSYGQLTGKGLEETKGKSLGEALRNITGVNSIQTGPSIFKPVIHGVHSQRVLILNNGIRQEGQQWGAEHAPEIDPFVASNVVVVKDAGAIKYGTDALGGVIIVNPAELPTQAGLGGSFHLLGNSNGRAGIFSGMLEGGIKNKHGWGWRVQGTGKKSGDAHAATYNLSNTGYQELNYSASAGHHAENKGFELFYSHFKTTIGILRGSAVGTAEDLANALEREPPQYTEPFTYNIQQPKQEVRHDLFKLNAHLTRGNSRFNVQYGFQYNQRKEFDFRQGELRDIPALGYNLYTSTIDAEWEVKYPSSRVSCRGINVMMQDNRKIDGTFTIPFIPNFLNYSGGIFWMERMSVAKWDLQAGARFDWKAYDIAGYDFENQRYRSHLDFHNLSGSLGATYNVNSLSSITSTLGSSWRPPNVAELYSLGTHQSAAAIEFGLLLDETTNHVLPASSARVKNEQAVKWVNTYRFQKSRFSGEVSAYVNYIFNYIFLKPRGVTQNLRGIFPYFRYTQTNASFLGTDIFMAYQVSPLFTINSRISLLRATDETHHDYLIFIPSNRYEVSVRYEKQPLQSWKNLFVEARFTYVAQQGRAPRVVTVREINDAKAQGVDLFASDNRNFDFAAAPPGYAMLGFSAGISRPVGNSQMDFRISINNLTNESYREYTNRMRYYANDLGRNVTLAIKYSF